MSGERGRNRAYNRKVMDWHGTVSALLLDKGAQAVKVNAPLLAKTSNGLWTPVGCTCGNPTCGLKNWGKHPAGGEGWQNKGTRNWADIEGWLLDGYNTGWMPTEGSRLVGLDFDGSGALGECFPDGVTPTLGDSVNGNPFKQHLWFTIPLGIDMATVPPTFEGGEVSRYGERSSRMLLAPMAMHVNGPRCWNENFVIPDLPMSALDWLQASDRKQKTERDAATKPSDPGWKIGEGKGRHPFLTSKAGQMRNAGMSGQLLLDTLRRFNEERCDPPIDDRDVQRMARDYDKREGNDDEPIHMDVPRVGKGEYVPPAVSPIVAIEDYLAGIPATIPWTIENVTYPGAVGLIAGGPKSGKSTLLASMDRDRQAGRPALGYWRTTPGRTLLITEEGGFAVRHKYAGATNMDVLDRRAVVLAGATKPDAWLELVKRWHDQPENNAGLVIVDTFARFMGVEDENNAAQTDAAMGLLLDAAQGTGFAGAAVHHTRKSGGDNGESIRGSSAILAAVDVALTLDNGKRADSRVLTLRGRVVFTDRFGLDFDRVSATYALSSQPDPFAEELRGIPTADEEGMTRDDLGRLWGLKDPDRRIKGHVKTGRLVAVPDNDSPFNRSFKYVLGDVLLDLSEGEPPTASDGAPTG